MTNRVSNGLRRGNRLGAAGERVSAYAAPGSERSFTALGLLLGAAFASILLTGGRDQGSLGVFLLVAGVVMLVFPPRQAVDCKLLAGAGVLWSSAALAFLPQRWFPTPEWRTRLDASLIPLGGSISLEPRATVFWWCILGLSLATGLFGLSQRIESRHRRLLAQGAAMATAGYGALAIYSTLSGWHFPFDVVETFGFFPNRNHTATFLFMGALLAAGVLGLPAERLGRASRWLAAVSLGICIVGLLFFSISRAGVILLSVGLALWAAGCGRLHWSKPRLFWLGALAVYGLLFFCAIPGEAQRRLSGLLGVKATAGASEGWGSRWPIYEDTLALLADFPLTGVGLGNFAPAFAQYRVHSLDRPKALHPESDWLMLMAECGGAALLGALALVALLTRQALAERASSGWPLRWALLVAAGAAALHGCVDVPAHRVPLGWWVLLLAGLAAQRGRSAPAPGRWGERLFFAAAGVGALALGGMLLRAEWFGGPALPPYAAEAASRAIYELQSRQPAAAVALAQEALRRAPTAEPLYEQLGGLLLNSEETAPEAGELFRAERLLNPTFPEVPVRQSELWWQREPARVPPLWREALRRELAIDGHTGSHNTLALFRRFLTRAAGSPALLQSLLEMIDFPLTAEARVAERAGFRLDLTLAWLEIAGPPGWAEAAPRILTPDPALRQLTSGQRTRFLRMWLHFGDPAALREAIARHPEWEAASWAPMAEASAARGEYAAACALLFRHLPPPPLPQLPEQPLASAESAAALAPDNFVACYQLFAAQRRAGEWAAAAQTLEKLGALPHAPGYVFYLQAEAAAALQHWSAAWADLERYEAASSP